MKILGILFLALILFPFCQAVCEEDQIDINSASAEELDEITHVGPAVAGYIIDARPFDSLDELVNVKYISENYLNDIKSEGLACVDESDANENSEDEEDEENQQQENEEDEEDEEDGEEQEKDSEDIEDEKNIEISYKVPEKDKPQNITLDAISLNTENTENKNKENSNLAIYGFVAFCILLGFLFIERKRRLNKNEFE